MITIKRLISITALLLFIFYPTLAQKQWSVVGSAGFTANAPHFLSFAVDSTGTPWVAYQDNLKATVMKYNGSSWVVVGNAGFSPGTMSNTSLAIDNSGAPYIAFRDEANGHKLTVMKYNGVSWVMVGSPGISTAMVGTFSLAFDKTGVLHVAYMNNTGNSQLWVKKFNGSNWVQVGNAASLGMPDDVVLKFDNNNIPWVAYRDFAYNARMTVMKLNGSIWSVVGGYGFSMGAVSSSHFDIDKGNTPYVANFIMTQNTHVHKFNGSTWVDIGNSGIPSADYEYFPSLAINNNNIPYIAFRLLSNGNKVTTMKYNGSSWDNVGNTDFSAGAVSDIILAFDKYNNIPFVAFIDSANNGKVTVMKLDCGPRPNVNICAALVDTITGKNTIVWDNAAPGVMAYKIYREDVGVYTLIGNVSGTVNSFVDPVANSTAQSYKYKLVVVDSCDGETNLNAVPAHQTIKLAFNYLINNKASVTWNAYSGIPNLIYTVKRSTNGGPFISIASFGINGTDTTYIDDNIPTGSNRYRIDAALAAPCVAGSASYNNITSNTATSWHTGIKSAATENQLQLAPNPVTNLLRIYINEPISSIQVLSLTGNKLMQLPGNGRKEMTADLGSLDHGVYMLRVNNTYNALFMKN